VPTTKCLVVFTHKLVQPGSLRWIDSASRAPEAYPAEIVDNLSAG
jgi:hypothetical protein